METSYTRFGRKIVDGSTTRDRRATAYVYYPTSIGVLNTGYAQGLTPLNSGRSNVNTTAAEPSASSSTRQSVTFSRSGLVDAFSNDTQARKFLNGLNPSLQTLSPESQALLAGHDVHTEGTLPLEQLNGWATGLFSSFQTRLQSLLTESLGVTPWR
jgi:hypothetical protein